MEKTIHTAKSIKDYILLEFNLEKLECGDEILESLAGYVNGDFVTLEGMISCLRNDKRIIEKAPTEHCNGLKIMPTLERRRVWFRRARHKLIASKQLGPLEEIMSRVVRLEKSVGQLVELHKDELEWEPTKWITAHQLSRLSP